MACSQNSISTWFVCANLPGRFMHTLAGSTANSQNAPLWSPIVRLSMNVGQCLGNASNPLSFYSVFGCDLSASFSHAVRREDARVQVGRSGHRRCGKECPGELKSVDTMRTHPQQRNTFNQLVLSLMYVNFALLPSLPLYRPCSSSRAFLWRNMILLSRTRIERLDD